MRRWPDGTPVMVKTVKVWNKPYHMTVYNNGDGYFSLDGTPETATPLSELEPAFVPGSHIVPDHRAAARQSFKSFAEGYTYRNIQWRYAE